MDISSLESRIKDLAPKEAEITKVTLEGSEIIVFSKNPEALLNDESLLRVLASEFKKRIHVRGDPSIRMPAEKALDVIKSLIPEEAGLGEIFFVPENGKVYIEAKKLGLVIGKQGQTLKDIALKTGWIPELWRLPSGESPTLKGVRHTLIKHAKEIQRFLKETGEKIYSEAKPLQWSRLTPLGGAREVGRSALLLETNNSKILLDCGINVASRDNAYPMLDSISFPINELDAVVISHAHLDHIGFVPYLYKYGYEGPTYCTPPTRDLGVLLMMDYIEVLAREGRDPPYGKDDIKEFVKHCITKEYGEVTDITPDMRITFHNAGHILGSATVHVHMGQGFHNLVYTGDFKFGYTRLFDPVETRYPRLETLIMESTYGGPQDVQPPRYTSEKMLIQTIQETIDNGGSVLIPVFSIGRAQEIMLVLEEYANNAEWDIPVYLDGMIKEASAIHTAYPEYMKRSIQKRILHDNSPFDSDIFIEVTNHKRDQIAEEGYSVILAPSGMLTGGPSVEYFKKMAENEKNTIIFVGYQGEGSLGRRIQTLGLTGSRGKEIPINEDGKTVALKVNMRIETIEGFSGHSDRNQLIGFFRKVSPRPKQTILVHGEEKKALALGRALSRWNGEVVVPRILDSMRLR